MVTGSPQKKHKFYYACLNFYPNGKEGGRKTKWIATGLPERGNKRRAEQITELLKPIFNKDGSLVDKYMKCSDPIEKIAQDIAIPEITLKSLREMLGEITKEANHDLEQAVLLADLPRTAEEESPEFIRKMLFCDYMVLWLERLAHKLDRATYGSYKGCVHGRIYDYFHTLSVVVEDLRPGHIEAFYHYLAKKCNLSQNTIIHYHCNIRKALQQLYVKQIIRSNPADLIENRPKRTIYQARYYNEDQINEYLQHIHGTKMELPVLLASFYGFRRSEVLGIMDFAIDMRNKALVVKHTVTKANVEHKVEILRKESTKSKESMRSMPLVDEMINAITEANERQLYYEKKLGSLYCREDRHYLCRDEYGKLLSPDYITSTHKALLEKYRMPHIRFHDLRHSCASVLLSKGVSLDKIQEWLGHADIQMTQRYAHLNVSVAKQEMAGIMSGLLKIR